MIYKKQYQLEDKVSSVVTTKVKGQGFVPIERNVTPSFDKNDTYYYEKRFGIDFDKKYRIFDTAGLNNIDHIYKKIITVHFHLLLATSMY